jgi:hypothetical protein
MSRILKRPMFRRGGSTNTGIMSGITDRTNYENGGIDLSGINKERLRGSATAIQSLLNELAPVPKTRLPIGDFGINLALGMSPIEALRDPYAKFTKADDIRRAQLAKRGQGAVSTALQLELARLKNQAKGASRLLTAAEKKDQGFNESDVVQIDAQGNRKVLKSTPAGEVEKRATRKTVISSIDKILGKVDKQGTGFFEGALKGLTTPVNPTRAKFEAEVKGLELNVIKALRGAQVSAAEEENVKKILPSVFDSETMFKAKAIALKEYLQELDTRIEGGVVSAGSQSKVLDEIPITNIEDFTIEVGKDGVYDVRSVQGG